MTPPAYFERVRLNAQRRWQQLEADAELAGPWRQLFLQVQSPSHVLSELLQNADDAGATEASAQIVDGEFRFEHNGEDFSEEQFASLCRFGYSNKRALHTIGFRGIGFKSTFSLGDPVRLLTPTLNVEFSSQRFTEPTWSNEKPGPAGTTVIRVAIKDPLREGDLRASLERWQANPISLLFFRSLRKLRILDHHVHWRPAGGGPIAGSEWMALDGHAGEQYLLIRSEPEQFPEECLREIAEERRISMEEVHQFPPCTVDLVVGAKGRLYVVLPTGVETDLPFACNAPFIQDPARFAIKHPDVSPTNTWLLDRCGRMAGLVLLDWINREELTVEERARAYDVLPGVDRTATELPGRCAALVELATAEVLKGRKVVLTESGSVVAANEATSVPRELLEVWPPATTMQVLTGKEGHVVAAPISDANRTKLHGWHFAPVLSRADVLNCLKKPSMSKPASLDRLRKLWLFIAPEFLKIPTWMPQPNLALLPTVGSDQLLPVSRVVRLGAALKSRLDDWSFLSRYVAIVSPQWVKAVESEGASEQERAEHGALREVMVRLELARATPIGTVIDRAARALFSGSFTTDEAVRLAHVAATENAQVGASFFYAVQEGGVKEPRHVVVLTTANDELLPGNVRHGCLLHDSYASGAPPEWTTWLRSARSGTARLLPVKEAERYFRGEEAARQCVSRLNPRCSVFSRYSSDTFRLVDISFEETYWRHWEALAEADTSVWWRVLHEIARADWKAKRWASLYQDATNGYTAQIIGDGLPAAWLRTLAAKPCIKDHRGQYRLPSEVLRRTPATQAVTDMESFVDTEFDTEANAEQLDLLGVGSAASGPERILDRLRSLAGQQDAPVREVEKWYRRLDEWVAQASDEEISKVRDEFLGAPLILTAGGEWVASGSVFEREGADVPGVALLRPSVADLSLWKHVGVRPEPTLEDALEWIRTLRTGTRLERDTAKRVARLQGLHAAAIWTRCGKGLNLLEELVDVSELTAKLTRYSQVEFEHLFASVLRATLDLRRASPAISDTAPLDTLPTLASLLEDRPTEQALAAASPRSLPWVASVANCVLRIQIDDEGQAERLREFGSRLARATVWSARSLEVEPFIGARPAGRPRTAEVTWFRDRILLAELSVGRLARVLPEYLARILDVPEVAGLLQYACDRSADHIRAYAEDNFTLIGAPAPVDAAPEAEPEQTDSDPLGPVPTGVLGSPDDEGAPRGAGTQAGPDTETSRPAVRPPTTSPPDEPRTPRQPTLIEVFLSAQKFRQQEHDLYVRADGFRAIRQRGDSFPWVAYDAGGNVRQRYLACDECLERGPVDLSIEVLEAMTRQPEHHTLVLRATDGTAHALSGIRLSRMQKEQQLKVLAAKYRLVLSRV
jgi:hypothetical protein